MSRCRVHHDPDTPEYDNKRYSVKGYGGVAFWVLGWQTEPDEDTEWTGIAERTGQIYVVMVGDDHPHLVDPEDLTEIAEEEYCSSCGQIGCGW